MSLGFLGLRNENLGRDFGRKQNGGEKRKEGEKGGKREYLILRNSATALAAVARSTRVAHQGLILECA